MAINETGTVSKKYRVLDHTDSDGKKWWNRLSFWHKAADCEFADGTDAETNLGDIKGITDSLESTSSNIAASAKAVNDLNNNLHKYIVVPCSISNLASQTAVAFSVKVPQTPTGYTLLRVTANSETGMLLVSAGASNLGMVYNKTSITRSENINVVYEYIKNS